MPKKTITLCMIALNEEEFIGRSLKKLKPFVDQIVVVDGGSSEIASKHRLTKAT